MNGIARAVRGAIGESVAGLARLLLGTRVRYAGCSPQCLTRQSIFFSNHSSHLDFVVLWTSLPKAMRATVRPVAAADYWGRDPVRRWLTRYLFNAVLIERGEAAKLPAARAANTAALREALMAGESLVIFPEGTRGNGKEVAAFRAGLFHIAEEWKEVQMVPVWLANLHRILPKGEVVPTPSPSRITFGPAMFLGEGEGKAAFLVRAREAVLALKGSRGV